MAYGAVAIPYSSGMLLLLDVAVDMTKTQQRVYVAIPYSSGMLLLHRPRTRTSSRSLNTSRNPLFIGNAFATKKTVIEAHVRDRSQSPIHRECFCYKAAQWSGGTWPRRRNPLFIGNAFATGRRRRRRS